ncbi:UNVERIFIED_CONTAM: hypothetical protein FKN15_004074 [Acipenser sinensis]
MTEVVDWLYKEREVEHSRLACAGAPWCSSCLCYGHEEANCPELDWNRYGPRMEGSEQSRRASQEEEPLSLLIFLGEVPLVEWGLHAPEYFFWGGERQAAFNPQQPLLALLRETEKEGLPYQVGEGGAAYLRASEGGVACPRAREGESAVLCAQEGGATFPTARGYESWLLDPSTPLWLRTEGRNLLGTST